MNITKRVTAVILVGIMLMSLSGCSGFKQRWQNNEYKAQAKKNAVTYIKEKYGFTPKVIKTLQPSHSGMFGSLDEHYSEFIYVTMKDENGKKFVTYSDGSVDNANGSDDYQYDEIVSALEKEINNIVPDVKCVKLSRQAFKSEPNDYDLKDFESEDEYCHLFDKYFDGENLDEVMNGCQAEISAYYVDTDLSKFNKEDKLRSFYKSIGMATEEKDYNNHDEFSNAWSDIGIDNTELELYSLRNENDIKNIDNLGEPFDEDKIEYNMLKLNCYKSIRFSGISSNKVEFEIFSDKYNKGEFDDFIYIVRNAPLDSVKFKKLKPRNFNEISKFDIKENDDNGEYESYDCYDIYKCTPLTNAYYMELSDYYETPDTDVNTLGVYVYYPLSKINGYDKNTKFISCGNFDPNNKDTLGKDIEGSASLCDPDIIADHRFDFSDEDKYICLSDVSTYHEIVKAEITQTLLSEEFFKKYPQREK